MNVLEKEKRRIVREGKKERRKREWKKNWVEKNEGEKVRKLSGWKQFYVCLNGFMKWENSDILKERESTYVHTHTHNDKYWIEHQLVKEDMLCWWGCNKIGICLLFSSVPFNSMIYS